MNVEQRVAVKLATGDKMLAYIQAADALKSALPQLRAALSFAQQGEAKHSERLRDIVAGAEAVECQYRHHAKLLRGTK